MFPPYLSVVLQNAMAATMMFFTGFFFYGTTFDYDPVYGIYGFFTDAYFSKMLYLSMMLSLGVYITFVVITKMFKEPIIPALALLFEPITSSFFLDILKVQALPGAFGMLGFFMIIPGGFLILVGQYLFQKKHEKEEFEHKVRLTKIRELRDTKLSRSRSPSYAPQPITSLKLQRSSEQKDYPLESFDLIKDQKRKDST